MYAIVKTGGKQYKVAEGDVISIEKLTAAPGDEVAFPAILFVDGDTVTHDVDALAQVAVTGEVVAQTKGPKIRIHKYKNKTGYHKRMGHRQKLTEVRIVSVGAGGTGPRTIAPEASVSAVSAPAPAASVPAAPAPAVPASAAPAPAVPASAAPAPAVPAVPASAAPAPAVPAVSAPSTATAPSTTTPSTTTPSTTTPSTTTVLEQE